MNTREEIDAFLRREARLIDARLRVLLGRERAMPPRLRRAMAHSLLGGGKRLRPVLLRWTYDALITGRAGRARLDRSSVLDVACAFEMIHTYSLIHDDLPAMDDDILRRGQPTCHVAFDEATAILAGDGLHALAFQVIAEQGEVARPVLGLLARAAGPAGMVGGQLEDLISEGRPVTARGVRRIHERKTAQLISAAMEAGAYLAGAPPRVCQRIREAGRWLGLAFQGADDLLDVTSTTGELGKSTGKDAAADKATWIRLEGLERARQRTARDGRRGSRLLAGALPPGPVRERLLGLGVLMVRRTS
jgi:geranylgeranyl pyrophosphate synthase